MDSQFKKSNKEFSIVIPVYNAENYLERCLKSILNNNFQDYEIIIVDDGSTDQSNKICEKVLAEISFYKILQTKHLGLTHARNYGIKHSNGRYIIYVDADDYVSESLLQNCWKTILSNNNPDIIFFDHWRLENNNKILMSVDYECGLYTTINEKSLFLNKKNKQCYFSSWAVCYKRELLEQYHCKEERISKLEDFSYVPECLMRANNFYYLKKPLYNYFANTENAMTTTSNTMFDYIMVYAYVTRWASDFDIIRKDYAYNFTYKLFSVLNTSIKNFLTNHGNFYSQYKNAITRKAQAKCYSYDEILNDIKSIAKFCLKYNASLNIWDRFSLLLLKTKQLAIYFYYRIFLMKHK